MSADRHAGIIDAGRIDMGRAEAAINVFTRGTGEGGRFGADDPVVTLDFWNKARATVSGGSPEMSPAEARALGALLIQSADRAEDRT